MKLITGYYVTFLPFYTKFSWNDQIAPVLDTCGWRCSVTPLSLSLHTAQQNPHMISDKLVKSLNETYYQQVM